MAVAWLGVKLTVCVPTPGEPVMKLRFSLTLTLTVSGVAGTGSAVIVNSASSPSVMGVVTASIFIRGLSLS